MLVAVQLFVAGLYLPPVLKRLGPALAAPPQMIISLPIHTAVWASRGLGALVPLVAVQLSVAGLYFPPVFNGSKFSSNPPQTIISLPVHTAV